MAASESTVTRQKRAGEAMRQRSRERLVQAAGEVFAEQGYAGATVGAIAERAGVSLQTLYTAWGSKRQLLRAYVEYTMTGSPTAITEGSWAPQLHDLLDAQSLSDPHIRMRQVARIFREISERMSLPWRLTRDGAAVDAAVAEDHAELAQMRRHSMAALLDGLDESSLRPGLTLEGAVDTMLVIASPSAHETLVNVGGYSLDDFERWVGDTLEAALLSPPPRRRPAGVRTSR
jgi:AcrR family transcriptional regulator